jgi:5-methylcytosine-specific restriction enzyme subunit McrC
VTPIVLRESSPGVEVELTPEVAATLAASKVVSVEPRRAGQWRVSAQDVVGATRIAGVELHIRPKMPIARLFFLLGYARNPSGWREDEVDVGTEDELVPAIAHAFERQADRAVRRGLLQGYRTVEDSLPVLRGRLRETDQMRRRFGLAVPLEVRFDDFTIDIAENRLLLAAARRLLRLPRVPVTTRHRLLRLIARLADVSPLVPGLPLPDWRPTRLNRRYHNVLHLAEIILAGGSIDLGGSDVEVSGFLLQMWRVFEDFTTVAISEALRAHGGRTFLQGDHHFDETDEVVMRPDLVWYLGDRPTAVLDAKYKRHGGKSGPNQDLYQMLAYCTVFGLRRGHLLYARGSGSVRTHVVRRAGVEIVQHAMDLTLPPHELLAQVEAVAAELVLAVR